MPTGYTAGVADGSITDLRTFALRCARGMGALIMMRDEPMDAPIPERFEPNTWNAEQLAQARAERDRLYALSEVEAEAEAAAEYQEKLTAKEKWLEERRQTRNRYNAMIAKVVPWQRAPDGLKELMLEQLHRGRDFDCPADGRYYDEPVKMTGAEWRSANLAKAERDILYHAEEDAKERARVESRNAWLAQLRTALASVDTLPKGQDSVAGLVRSKGSAVGGEADETPNKTQRNHPHD